MRSLVLALALSVGVAGCAVGVDERSGLGGHHLLGASSDIEPIGYRGAADDGVVIAESRYGSARVSGPTRVGARGRREVRLPGGTWLECGRSCSETLRRETVDFWQGRDSRGGAADGPGYFRWGW
jgi:hypothetical protein